MQRAELSQLVLILVHLLRNFLLRLLAAPPPLPGRRFTRHLAACQALLDQSGAESLEPIHVPLNALHVRCLCLSRVLRRRRPCIVQLVHVVEQHLRICQIVSCDSVGKRLRRIEKGALGLRGRRQSGGSQLRRGPFLAIARLLTPSRFRGSFVRKACVVRRRVAGAVGAALIDASGRGRGLRGGCDRIAHGIALLVRQPVELA
mmetsp:Transcript_10906/g.26179  ORF Transcript_10906/g.26179 Transcript_10906/m.26179 type:complete len:203 (+) Transcript_10906:1065-1673(+)